MTRSYEYKQTALACGVCQCLRKLVQYHIIQRIGVLCRHVFSIHGIDNVWFAGHDFSYWGGGGGGGGANAELYFFNIIQQMFTLPIRNIIPTQTTFDMWIAALELILSSNFTVTSKIF